MELAQVFKGENMESTLTIEDILNARDHLETEKPEKFVLPTPRYLMKLRCAWNWFRNLGT